MLFLLWYEIYNYAFLFILTARNLRQIQFNSRNNVGHNGSAYSVSSLVLIPVFTKVLHNKSTSHLKSFVQYEQLLALQLHNSTSGEDRNLSIMKRAPGLSISHMPLSLFNSFHLSDPYLLMESRSNLWRRRPPRTMYAHKHTLTQSLAMYRTISIRILIKAEECSSKWTCTNTRTMMQHWGPLQASWGAA